MFSKNNAMASEDSWKASGWFSSKRTMFCILLFGFILGNSVFFCTVMFAAFERMDWMAFIEHLTQHPSPFATHPIFGHLWFNAFVYEKEDVAGGGVFGKGDDLPRQSFFQGLDVDEDSRDSVYVVTGASAGIGLATAFKLVPWVGAEKVIFTARNMEKLATVLRRLSAQTKHAHSKIGLSQEVPDVLVQNPEMAQMMKLDLASLKSVVYFADELTTRLGQKGSQKKKVVLINNAGIAYMAEKKITRDGFEMQFQSNYLGHYLLTRVLEKRKMLKRVVHVSSCWHMVGRIPENWEHLGTDFSYKKYADTKAMNNMFNNKLTRMIENDILARKSDPSNSTEQAFTLTASTVVHPGIVGTDVTKDYWWIKFACDMLTHYLKFRWFILRPAESASHVLFAAFDQTPFVGMKDRHGDLVNSGTHYVVDMEWKRQHPYVMDKELQDRLWDESEKLLRACLGDEHVDGLV